LKRAHVARQTERAMPPELLTLPSELHLRAAIDAKSYDPKTGEFEMTISTGAAVERVEWWSGNRWVERLQISKGAIDLARLKDGAPLADTHNVFSLDGVVGVMRDAWVEGEGENARLKGRGKISMADDPKLARVRRDVEDGVIRNVSVGYRVRKWQITKADAEKGTLEERLATRWVPHEVSLVPVGADPGAGIGRSEPSRGGELEQRGEYSPEADGSFSLVRAFPGARENESTRTDGARPDNAGAPPAAQRQETTMPPEAPVSEEEKKRAEAEAQRKLEAEKASAAAAERQRVLDIQATARSLSLKEDDETVRDLIAKGTDADKAARALIGRAAQLQEKIQPAHSGRASVGEEQYGRMLEGAELALSGRMGVTGVKTDEGPAREMRNLSMLDLARELAVEKGTMTRAEARSLSKRQMLERALHGSSDFPKITANAANKRMQQAYTVQPKTFLQVVRVVDVPDFKQVSVAHLGGISALEEVGEHGEFHYATIGEKAETYVLSTWGKILALSRQLIINDDLRAFADMTSKLGRAASVLENNLHWALRTGNKVMSDALGVYHSTHGNVGTKALGVAGLAEGFMIMLKQRDVAPKTGELGDFINVTPAVLTVPPELLSLALQLTADITPNAVSAVNPYRGKLKVEVEPRLSAAGVTNGTTSWFLDAAPSDWPTWEVAYLEGERGPVIESREGFEVDGMEFKVRHDVAMAPIDWVGTFRSDGTVA
jgi:HK97 family phage prohead protease